MTIRVSAGGVLMIAAGVASLALSLLCVRALLEIYSWYPQLIVQSWVGYVQLLTAFSLLELVSSVSVAVLSLMRKMYVLTMILAVLTTFSGAGAWLISMIVPGSRLLDSILYYFLPMLLAPLVATLLIYPRRKEFRH
jgi:multisubunit Na+/H+ antiporter MnhE subunit